jgi:hypothetical protein
MNNLNWRDRVQDSSRLDGVAICDPQHSLIVDMETTASKLFPSWASSVIDILISKVISPWARCAAIWDCVTVINHHRGVASAVILGGILPTIPIADVCRVRVESRREAIMKAAQNMADFMHPDSSIDIINIIVRHGIVWVVTDVDIAQPSVSICLVDQKDKISGIIFPINQCRV